MSFLEDNHSTILTNISYLELNGEITRCVYFINQNKLNEAFTVVNCLNQIQKTPTMLMYHTDFAIASCLNYITDALVENKTNFNLKGCQTISFIDSFNTYFHMFKAINTKSNLGSYRPNNNSCIKQNMDTVHYILSKFCRSHMRETTLILLFQIDKYEQAQKLMFKAPLIQNLDQSLFDFLILSSVSKFTFKCILECDSSNSYTTKTKRMQKEQLTKKLGDFLATIKKNVYTLVEENAKNMFVKIYNQCEVASQVAPY